MSAGLFHSAQSLLAGLLALGRTRLELFGTELQEELTRLFFTLIGAIAVLLLTAMGLAFAGLAVLVSLPGEHRAIAAAVTAGVRGGISIGKRGIFYDRDNQEWDATIVDLIVQPISRVVVSLPAAASSPM